MAAAVVATLPLVGLLALGPVAPLLLLVAAGALLLAAFRPKAFALLAGLVVVSSSLIQNVAGSAGSFADEGVILLAVVALAARRLVTEGRLVWLPGTLFFAGFLVVGLVSAVLADVPADVHGLAAFLAVKGVLFAFALAQLRWTREDLVTLVRVGIAALVTVALTGLVNLVAPVAWAQLTTGRPPVNYIGGLPALNGIFQHPAAFSRFCGVLAVGCLVYGFVVRRSLANTLLLAVSGGLALLTFQVKSIVGLIATLAVVGARFLRATGVVAVLCLAPILAVTVLPPLVELVRGDLEIYVLQDSARSLLTAGGAVVAAQYFPFGAGFGRYGSSVAADSYSPLYHALGFDDRFGLSRETGQFLNDTQWPAIYGETGWFGAALFAAGLAAMLLSLLRRVCPDEDAMVRWIRITGVGWMTLLLVESLVAPVFVSPPSYPFVFAAAGIVASLRVSTRDRRGAAPGHLRTGRGPDDGAAPVPAGAHPERGRHRRPALEA